MDEITSREAARRSVEVLERALVAFNDRDFEAVLSFISEGMELHPAIGGALTGATTYPGREGMRRYWEDILEVFEDFALEPVSYSAWRDYTVVPTRVKGHGISSGMDIDVEMTMIWRVRDNQIVWGATFFDRAEGLEAIGTSEGALEPILWS